MYYLKNSIKILSIILIVIAFKMDASAQQCPTIFINDMNNVPGYPKIDDVSVCGVPDTITFYILNTSGQVLNSSEFTLQIPQGFQYANYFEFVDANYPVNQGSTTDLTEPSFVIETNSIFYIEPLNPVLSLVRQRYWGKLIIAHLLKGQL